MADASMHEPAESAVELERLSFGWPSGEPLLEIEHLALRRGERVLLTGPSGSGKSTLLALIAGVMRPRSGSVRILGVPVSALSAAARDRFRGDHIGLIFQMFNLIPYLTVRQNVLLPLGFSAGRRARLDAAPDADAERLLGALGLGGNDLLHRSVTQLSIGQQQRVAAARALIGRPELLIADEPTSALDSDARADFLRLVMHECARSGTTLLLVSHDPTLAPLFDRTIEFAALNRRAAHAG